MHKRFLNFFEEVWQAIRKKIRNFLNKDHPIDLTNSYKNKNEQILFMIAVRKLYHLSRAQALRNNVFEIFMTREIGIYNQYQNLKTITNNYMVCTIMQ